MTTVFVRVDAFLALLLFFGFEKAREATPPNNPSHSPMHCSICGEIQSLTDLLCPFTVDLVRRKVN